ncbi:MAG: gamma-glutamyl-gamma-aminobutyrate hydrolase family protein [Kineosporiaceae bacterium]
MPFRDARRRPLIAIPARFSASASALRYAAEVSARKLIEAVYAAGGEPVVIHPHAPGGVVSDAEVRSRIAFADGVLLPGGGDLAARWSGQGEHEELYDVDVEQDAFDLALARVCLADGVPLLAICRGLQVVTVARGGSLVQHMGDLPDAVRADHRHHVHQVSVEPDSVLAEVVPSQKIAVSCYHHQCVDVPGEGMVVIARAEDGTPEAYALPAASGWFLGVQWHPEDTARENPDQAVIFAAHVRAAAHP